MHKIESRWPGLSDNAAWTWDNLLYCRFVHVCNLFQCLLMWRVSVFWARDEPQKTQPLTPLTSAVLKMIVSIQTVSDHFGRALPKHSFDTHSDVTKSFVCPNTAYVWAKTKLSDPKWLCEDVRPSTVCSTASVLWTALYIAINQVSVLSKCLNPSNTYVWVNIHWM